MKTVFLMFVLISSLFGMSNYELAQKSEAVMSGFKDSVATMKMTLMNTRGDKKIRTMLVKILEAKKGNKLLMEFLSPADVKGTKFLNYEHADKDDDQWLYLPALKRVKRIASRNKSGSFMGSEFSFEDLSAFNADNYKYEGDALESKGMYQLQSVPISRYSGYTKLISFIDAKTFLIKKIKYYDRKNKLLKIAVFQKYKKFANVYRIGKITMKNIQNDKTTILVWSDEKIGTGLTQKDFSKRYLKR